MIELRALGTAEIHTGSATLTPAQEIVFAAGLYLVQERGKRVSRSRLAAMIWPDTGEEPRAHRLRQTIFQLKKLGFQLAADRNALYLNASEASCDSDLLSHSTGTTVSRLPLDFLPGYSPTFSGPFRDWVDSLRNEFQASATSILLQELGAARLKGDWQSVERIAARCLSLDPFNETAVLATAEAAAMRGSKRRAVSILDSYIAEIGEKTPDMKLPATILRRRVVERIPERPALLNADPAFVGRETEMAALSRSFELARAGRGSATLVVGDPGIGKTRLSAELARFAELRGATVERATCRRADLDRPLSLFVDIVPRLRDMPGALGCNPETFALLRRLTEFEKRPDGTRAIETEMLFEEVRAALFDLLESIVDDHCLVIVIEDLQWLDKTSAQLLVRMVEWSGTRRIYFLLNARPSENAFLAYAEKLRVEAITLGRLDPSASSALLKSIALRPGDELEPGFVNWCLAVADGNPFFLQELANQWIETGRRYEAPPSVSKVLEERLSRLSPEALQVLQTAAVLNDHSTLNRVERVLEYQSHQLLAGVEELNRAAMLGIHADNADVPKDHVQPRHDFLSAAAVSRLSPMSLAFLHRRAADVLEVDLRAENASATLLWACAAHRHHAGDRVRALSLSLSCAEHLLDLGLAGDACSAYQKSMDYCATDSERLKVWSQLARAFELDGEWKKSIEVLRLCSSVATKVDPHQGQHNDYELLMLDARHRSALDFRNLLEESLICVNNEDASPRHRLGAAVLAMKLSVDFGRSDLLDAIYSQVARFLDSPEVRELNSLEVQTIYRTDRGDGVVPLADLRRLVEAAHRTEGELSYSTALLMAGTACRMSGRYEHGLGFVSEALEHAIAHRLHSRRRHALLSATTLHIAAGEFEKARQTLTALRENAYSSDSAKESNEIHMLEARIAIEQGDFTLAARAFSQADKISPAFSVARKGFSLAVEVRLRLHENADTDTIRPLVSELESAHVQMRRLGSQDFEGYSLFLGLCALGEKARGLELLREYLKERRVAWPVRREISEALGERSNAATVLER